ncbi:P-loop ATPase, Sll1717 family [Duganella sp. CF517]|uniref:P-loop ATPase, Sll1717 family n=1 Tax=Duganella sp. CF517 TaxID=1881038 RepID=UPI0035A2C565
MSAFFYVRTFTLFLLQRRNIQTSIDIEPLRWSHENLLRILNKRINFNRSNFLLSHLTSPFETVFPVTVGTSNTDNWMIERTLGRPRELIQLARYYTESVENGEPSAEKLKDSEQAYSSWKLDDLCTEYSNQYPGLITIFSFWKTKFFRQKYHLKKSEIEEMLLRLTAEVELNADWFNKIVDDIDLNKFLRVLYEIGFIGDFVQGGQGGSKTCYAYSDRHEPLFEEVQIHPCFRKAVHTVERIRTERVSGATPP